MVVLPASKLRQNCVKIASKLRQNYVKIASKIASKLRRNCVKIAPKLRQNCVKIASNWVKIEYSLKMIFLNECIDVFDFWLTSGHACTYLRYIKSALGTKLWLQIPPSQVGSFQNKLVGIAIQGVDFLYIYVYIFDWLINSLWKFCGKCLFFSVNKRYEKLMEGRGELKTGLRSGQFSTLGQNSEKYLYIFVNFRLIFIEN
jgi:hypothetical protein